MAGNGIKALIVLAALLIASLLLPVAGQAAEGDAKQWQPISPVQELPFPRGARAQSVWDSGTCWSECGSYCAWGSVGCLTRDTQGHCLKLTDTCDRYCQHSCRSSGGPLMPLDFFWD